MDALVKNSKQGCLSVLLLGKVGAVKMKSLWECGGLVRGCAYSPLPWAQTIIYV
ncbi:hypothetical protein GCM10025776_00590 [Corallincola platygyrae]